MVSGVILSATESPISLSPKENDLLWQLQDLSAAVRSSSIDDVVVLQAAKSLVKDLHRSLQARLRQTQHQPQQLETPENTCLGRQSPPSPQPLLLSVPAPLLPPSQSHPMPLAQSQIARIPSNATELSFGHTFEDRSCPLTPKSLLDRADTVEDLSHPVSMVPSLSEPPFDLLDLVTTPSMESAEHKPLFQRRSLADSATGSLSTLPSPGTSLGALTAPDVSHPSHPKLEAGNLPLSVEQPNNISPAVALPIIPRQSSGKGGSFVGSSARPLIPPTAASALLDGAENSFVSTHHDSRRRSSSRLSFDSTNDPESHHQSISPLLPRISPTTIYNGGSGDKHAARSNPRVLTEAVFTVMRSAPAEVIARYGLGWMVLQAVWNLTPGHFDPGILDILMSKKTARQTEEILLAIAAVDLRHIRNLSAFASAVIKEHETMSQVCMRFLAGMCHNDQPDHQAHCPFVHPERTIGWEVLKQRWNVTYRDIDYAAISYLCKQPADTRDRILVAFSEMNLKSVKNLSAYLSRAIRMSEATAIPQNIPDFSIVGLRS